jgi:hypothetical protein
MSDKWTEHSIILPRSLPLAEPTIEAVGVLGDIVSEHAEIIIIDDPCNFTNSQNHRQRQKIIEWLLSVFDIVTKEGKIIVIGTRWHPDDVYRFILANKEKRFSNWETIIRQAILPDGTPWFTDKFTIEDLEQKKREKGYVLFLAQYMNDVTAMEDRLFKSHWIKLYTDKTKPKGFDMVTQGIDLAVISERRAKQENKKNAAYTAEVTIGITDKKDIYVLDVWKKRIGFRDQKEIFKSKGDQFKPHKIGLESNQYQHMMAEELMDTTLLPVVPIPSTASKEARARRLSVLMQNGKIHIHESMGWFIDELVFWPDKGKDTVDAFGRAIEVVDEKKKAIFMGGF